MNVKEGMREVVKRVCDKLYPDQDELEEMLKMPNYKLLSLGIEAELMDAYRELEQRYQNLENAKGEWIDVAIYELQATHKKITILLREQREIKAKLWEVQI